MKKYVSIILPTFNRANKILESLNSVLEQTYPYFELIIVDDGSTDNTETVVSRVRDSRVRYFKLDVNQGAAIARNFGIKQAKYPYIAFQDSDDIWMKNKLERQLELLVEDIGLVYCSYRYIKDNQESIIPSRYLLKDKLAGDIFLSLLESNKIGTPTILVKKECLETVGLFNEELSSLEDWELAIRIAKKYKIAFIEDALVVARYSINSVNQQCEKQLQTILYIEELYREYYSKKNIILSLVIGCVIHMNSNQIAQWLPRIIPNIFPTEEIFWYIVSRQSLIEKMRIDSKIQECLCSKNNWDIFQNTYIANEPIAIYGLGSVGITLLNRAKENDVQIVALIDKSEKRIDGMYTVIPSKLVGIDIKKIIVTIHAEFNAISEEIKKYNDAECINIKEILG